MIDPRSPSKSVVRHRWCLSHTPGDSGQSMGLTYFLPGWTCCPCGPWSGQARAACAGPRTRKASWGGPGASRVDASWVLGLAVVKKSQTESRQMAVGVACGMDGLMVFYRKMTRELRPACCGSVLWWALEAAHMIKAAGGTLGETRAPAGGLVAWRCPIEPTVVSSIRNPLQDPAQARCWWLFSEWMNEGMNGWGWLIPGSPIGRGLS